MTKNDWYEAGDQIKKLVQDAVDSKDFAELSSTITNVVNSVYEYTNREAADRIRRNMEQRRSAQERGEAYEEQSGETYRESHVHRSQSGGTYQESYMHRSQGGGTYQESYMHRSQGGGTYQESHVYRSGDGETYRDSHVYRGSDAASSGSTARPSRTEKTKLKVQGEISGNIMKWTGYSMSGIFGLAGSAFAVVGLAAHIRAMLIPAGIMAVCFAGSLGLGLKGSGRVKLANRFRRYRAVLGERTYCMVEELASAIGKNSKFVRKDLKKMIGSGFFEEGYLAEKETLLITDRNTYQQYVGAQNAYAERTKAASQSQRSADSQSADSQSRRSADGQSTGSQKAGESAGGQNGQSQWKPADQLDPRCREIVEEGRKYIQHIHECNEKIPGQEISAKLDRLELVITRIFREAEKNPDKADDLKKMMSYYLPTTSKLLDAYCELDEQPVAGQNIESTKKEIESALDTINTAFENLLDSLFEEKAWDISSDISVLNTMLAQEGLMGNDFSRKRGGEDHE